MPASGGRLDALRARLEAMAREGEAIRELEAGLELTREESAVLVATDESAARLADEDCARVAAGGLAVLVLSDADLPAIRRLPHTAALATLPVEARDVDVALALDGLFERLELRRRDRARAARLDRVQYELGELLEIASAVTRERDISRLLDLILERSRYITGADAGSIYVVENAPSAPAERILRFKLSQNDSCAFASREFTMPVSTSSIAGTVVLSRVPSNIPDVYALPVDSPMRFDRSFDEKVGYRTRSMITVPMISAEGAVIGVIQLINKKRVPSAKLDGAESVAREVVPFDERSQQLLESLASQAGIALENALLYDEIHRIFEGFVRASVQAIEQRDPTTSGHSLRVSQLSCRLAELVDRVDAGPYADVFFSPREIKELEYAALLHDFGKIGVREQVLVKAKKLYPHELDAIRARLELAVRGAEVEVHRRRAELVLAGAGGSDLARLDDELRARRQELEEAWRVIMAANEPTVLSEGDFSRIDEVARVSYVDTEGRSRRLLTREEQSSLRVRKGSLQPEEVEEIRSHVVHTYNFLSKIPWGRALARVPAIAGAHHERLNGSGYPRRVRGEEIPVQSKIMTIADIYDALTARDRPYKKAIPYERALEILELEVRDGHVERELVRLFREAEVYRVVDEAPRS